MTYRPLSNEEARSLQRGFGVHLAVAISASVTQFLARHRDRIPEREHMVGLIVDLISEGRADPKVLERYVAIEEKLHADPSVYDEAEETLREAEFWARSPDQRAAAKDGGQS